MTAKTLNDKHLSSPADDPAQEGWEILGVPLRPGIKAQVRVLARRAGLRPAQWARQVITDAVSRAA